jgi:sec-independent protein translocase protein TatB
MFDLTSSKLLILAVVALLVIGPKDLPRLLRTIGQYVGMIKRQAAEFRAQFDEAMRESELAELKKDVESITSDVETSVREVEHSVKSEMDGVRHEMAAAADATGIEADAHDMNGIPIAAKPGPPLTPAAAAAAAAAASTASPDGSAVKSGT